MEGFIAFLFVLAILGFFIIRAIMFTNNFKTISLGMTYDEVVGIIGKPKKEIDADNIKNCTWKKAVLRGWSIERTITFKNGRVFSTHNR